MEDFFEDIKNRPRPNLFRRMYLWWNHDGKYLPKEIKRGIQRTWYWLPIIWKDRDWDGHYIFEIMKHKLQAQAQYIGDRDFHTRAQQDARRMRLCVKLMQKVQDEDYTMEYMEYHKDRVWFTDCEDRPGSSLMNSEQVWEKFDDYFKKYPLIYKRVMNGEGVFGLEGREDDKHVIAMNIAHLNHDRARKLLFKIMEENIEGWWD
jgi:hypothetical protein